VVVAYKIKELSIHHFEINNNNRQSGNSRITRNRNYCVSLSNFWEFFLFFSLSFSERYFSKQDVVSYTLSPPVNIFFCISQTWAERFGNLILQLSEKKYFKFQT